MLYNFVKRKQPNPGGALDYAFLPAFSLPIFQLQGAGIAVPPSQFSPVQPEQVYYSQLQYENGFSGIVAGQMARIGLLDMRGL